MLFRSLFLSMGILRPISKTVFNILAYSFPSEKVRLQILKKGYSYVPSKTYRTIKESAETERSGFDKLKSQLILNLNLQTPEEAVPFYKLPIKTLLHIVHVTKNDEKNGFCKNRLYYISSYIKCSPTVLSEKLAKRTFIFSLSFDWLENSLKVLSEFGVPGERIMRDLWVLKYHHETIRNRFQLVRDMGVDHLYPWMVRCSENILHRSIRISQDTKNILGESESTQIYLANRLNTSIEVIEEMCCKIPALKTIRVTKVKNFLDYLISEGFTEEEIVRKPRVLSASQKTVKQRLDELRQLGLSDINLNVLCKSKKDFKKYSESIESLLKDENKIEEPVNKHTS